MNRLRWLALLMGVAIIGITGFQLYWLKQNYTREKRSLAIKTEATFREAILQLQTAKLNLGEIVWNKQDSGSDGKVKIIMNKDGQRHMNVNIRPRPEMISSINIIRNKLNDSLKTIKNGKPGVVISMSESNSVTRNGEPVKVEQHIIGRSQGGSYIFNMLYGVDSLQDSLRIVEVDSAYKVALKEQKLSIPFSISKNDNPDLDNPQPLNEVVVGFAKPVSFQLNLGNTVPYLFRQITQPILFSVLLLGITILSFVLLYRNLLRQQRLAALKNEFISNITHELKTPIATVGVAIEALKNFNAIDDPKRTREYLDISQNELQRLSLLVDKVLKLSMFEKKEVELKYETVDLKEVVDEVVGSLKLQFEKNNASITVDNEGNLVLQADRLHLLSVVFNLLDNALKYSKENLSVQISLTEKENAIALTVTDNGIGIDAEYKEKIFEKFFRVPHGDTHNAKGYGLGLSYVARVIEQHKGTIAVESQPGIGTSFTFTLPKKPA